MVGRTAGYGAVRLTDRPTTASPPALDLGFRLLSLLGLLPLCSLLSALCSLLSALCSLLSALCSQFSFSINYIAVRFSRATEPEGLGLPRARSLTSSA